MVTFGYVFYAATFLANGLVGLFIMNTVYPGLAASEGGLVDATLEVSGFVGLVVIFVSQTRINTANYYLASTNLEAFAARYLRLRWPRLAWVGIAGALVYLLMLTDVLSYLLRAPAWQGVAVVAWVAIALTHIAVAPRDPHGLVEFRPGRVPAFLPGAWAILVATAVGIFITEEGTPGSWYVLTAPLITFALAAAVYAVALRAGGSRLLKRRHDPRDEIDDVWRQRVRCHVCDRSCTAVEMDRDPSAGQDLICAACAEGSGAFMAAVRAEARSLES
ncbi:hypothetical protein [Streptomyces heilongjiangensis]|uniref:Uncharacterized protein n=1 Tax=Streptomyces heilongjiangensis TaxID=945052 RepID=A0ABW1BAU3_9ACTN|nr:hypothetical protein [Streptomyces heilongjiangensis]MDC2951166.1 hypothetical protein [Streptomyces heilongjiangensis]